MRETIDATLNRVSSSGVQGASYFSGSINSIERDADGSYLAVRCHRALSCHPDQPVSTDLCRGVVMVQVSSRGNFYLTWRPGDEFWVPHNRDTSRRITAMGFIKNRLSDGLWMTTAGGEWQCVIRSQRSAEKCGSHCATRHAVSNPA